MHLFSQEKETWRPTQELQPGMLDAVEVEVQGLVPNSQ